MHVLILVIRNSCYCVLWTNNRTEGGKKCAFWFILNFTVISIQRFSSCCQLNQIGPALSLLWEVGHMGGQRAWNYTYSLLPLVPSYLNLVLHTEFFFLFQQHTQCHMPNIKIFLDLSRYFQPLNCSFCYRNGLHNVYCKCFCVCNVSRGFDFTVWRWFFWIARIESWLVFGMYSHLEACDWSPTSCLICPLLIAKNDGV